MRFLMVLLLSGCTTIPPECRTEYAHTIYYCPPKPKIIETEKQCREAGGISILEDGEFKGCVSRERIQEVLDRIIR